MGTPWRKVAGWTLGPPLLVACLGVTLWAALQAALFLPLVFGTPPGTDEKVWVTSSYCRKYWADDFSCAEWGRYRTQVEVGTRGFCEDPWAGGWVWDLVAWHVELPWSFLHETTLKC
ncbi:hypothetical protein [Candidatus Poriferisocius sp.]|uniref:hypothetical protein n=1 Tax=Candidatus Poriferisocius sp. TaxID=3101276 RepID=UPI003B0150AB